ncbi:MAG: flagellar motor switch protein FliN [Pirellulaceae bacterium]
MKPSLPKSNPSQSSNASIANASVAQMERLIDDATEGVKQAVATDAPPQDQFKPFHLDRLTESSASGSATTIETLAEVELDLRIELGRTQMTLQDVLQLRDGSVVTLDTFAGDPVNIFVNDRIVARGEILVMNDQFCVRVTELVGA